MILLVQPRDSLIVRDGRPFAAFPGAKVRSYAFPPPQVIAGAVRGILGRNCGFQEKDNRWQNLLKQVRIEGLLLYDRSQSEIFYPAPQDALLLKVNKKNQPNESDCEEEDGVKAKAGYMLYRLQPERLREEELTNLLDGLNPVFAPKDLPKGKPASMPAFWKSERFVDWLLGKPEHSTPINHSGDLGIERLSGDVRIHVKINPGNQTAEESMLFETRGLEFLHAEKQHVGEGRVRGEHAQLSGLRELALLLRVQVEPPEGCARNLDALLKGVHPIGGERRLALWEPIEADLWPETVPQEIIKRVIQDRRARLVLLTPADFNIDENAEPYLPPKRQFGGAKIRAAAVGRPLTVSGWDMLAQKPKPSRRLVPAGSVYFVDLSEVADIEAWIRNHWMKTLREQPNQSQRDGYGLAVVGVWRKDDAEGNKA